MKFLTLTQFVEIDISLFDKHCGKHLKFDKNLDKYQVMAWKQLAETLVVLFSRTQLPALHLVALQLCNKWSRLKILKIALFSN